MSQNGKGGLGVAEGVGGYGCSGVVVELLFEESEPSLEVLDDILEIGATLVMFHVSSAHYLPVLGLQQLFNLIFGRVILLKIPPLKEPHLAVKKGSLCTLRPRPLTLSDLLTLHQHPRGRIEYLLHRMKSITGKISHHVTLIG